MRFSVAHEWSLINIPFHRIRCANHSTSMATSVAVDLVSVSRGAKQAYVVDVEDATNVSWNVRVQQSFDIGLEIHWRPRAPAIGQQRVQPLLRIENDSSSFSCTSPGSLEFCFDNSYSMMRGKTVEMRISKEPLTDVSPSASIAMGTSTYDVDAMNKLCEEGVSMFFNNQFNAAEKFFEKEKNRVSRRISFHPIIHFHRVSVSPHLGLARRHLPPRCCNTLTSSSVLFDARRDHNYSLVPTSLAYPLVEPMQIPVFALSYATIAWLRGLMTWEPDQIAEANRRLRAAGAVAEAYMPKDSGLLGSIKGVLGGGSDSASPANEDGSSTPLPSGMTPQQLEASVVYAEVTLLSGLLNLMEESVMGLVRCGLSIRSGWMMYSKVDKALGNTVSSITGGPPLRPGFTIGSPGAGAGAAATPTHSAAQLAHVRSALCFGVGTFNVVASILPPIVLKVIAIVGYPSNRHAGLACLRQALTTGGVRSPLSGLIILAMRVLIPSFHSGDISEHVPEAQAILDVLLDKYSDSALFLWMAGRLARMRREQEKAAAYFTRCAATSKELPQLAHLCDYELSWCKAFTHDWAAVARLNASLKVENNWSKAFYCYMQGVAALEVGNVADARRRMVEVLRLGSRKLGGKVIPAEQYAVRRAAEFVALTAPPQTATEGSDASVDEPSQADLGGPLPVHRIRLPASVVPGSSPSHCAALAYPCTLPGLESIYLFNGFNQMQEADLNKAVAQVDAVLGCISDGSVFDASSPAWSSSSSSSPQQSVDGGGGAAWLSSSSSSSPSTRTPSDICATLDRAAGVSSTGITLDGSTLRGSGASGDAGTPRKPAQQQAVSPQQQPKKGFGGFGLGGLVKGIANVASTAVNTVGSAVSTVSSAVTSVAAAAGVGGGGTNFATASPLLPVHAAAIAALCRGAACAGLGRADEAAACYGWVMQQGEAGRLKRELHVWAYSSYEMGILYLDLCKAIIRRGRLAAGAGSEDQQDQDPAVAAKHAKLLSSQLATGLSLSDAKKKCVEYMRAAKSVKDDFNWRVRLHIRVHLAYDDMRDSLGQADRESRARSKAGGAAGAARTSSAATPGASADGGDDEADDDLEEEVEGEDGDAAGQLQQGEDPDGR